LLLLLLLLLLHMPVFLHDQLRLSVYAPRELTQQQIPAPLERNLYLSNMSQLCISAARTKLARLSNKRLICAELLPTNGWNYYRQMVVLLCEGQARLPMLSNVCCSAAKLPAAAEYASLRRFCWRFEAAVSSSATFMATLYSAVPVATEMPSFCCSVASTQHPHTCSVASTQHPHTCSVASTQHPPTCSVA
jgi:hypothetical protein